MASLTRKPRSKFWFACFRDVNGRQHRRTTEKTNRKEAMKIAEQYEAVAQRKLPGRKVKETISELYREIYQDSVSVATVRQFSADWLKAKESEVAPSTMDRYREAIKKLLEFLGDLADHDLNVVTRRLLLEFRGTLSKQLAPGTANLMLRQVRRLFREARRDGYIVENPAEFLEPVRNDSDDARSPFTVAEIQRILEIADLE
jgi:integrase